MMILPKIPYLTPILCGLSLVAGLYGGYKLTANHYDAKADKAKEAVIEQLAHQAQIDRETIVNLQVNERTLQKAYIELGRKAKNVQVTTSKCTLTDAGVGLWNESLVGEAGVSETPSGTTGTGGTDFAEAFENKLLNDEKCSKMRKRLEQLKEWDQRTFGD